MSQLNANLPYIQCFIRNKYILPEDDGGLTEGYIFGCKAMINRPMHFHFQTLKIFNEQLTSEDIDRTYGNKPYYFYNSNQV